MPDDPVIVVDGLCKKYRDTTALNGIDLHVAEGEVLGLLGPNGAGKTTTINVLSTLTLPDSGSARVAGFDVASQPARVREVISLTGQFAAVDQELTGRENLVLIGRLLGLPRAAAQERATDLLAQFALGDAAQERARGYSGGMRRRLDLAASLMVEPRVLFLDEPTTGLDPRSRRELWAVVRDLTSRGITVLLTTQYLDEADALADRIVVVDHGRVIAEGTADALKSQVGGAFCELDLVDASQLSRALWVLRDFTPTSGTRPERLSFAAPRGALDLADGVRLLGDAGVAMTDVSLRRPSLDDVFLALTGETVAEEDGGDSA